MHIHRDEYHRIFTLIAGHEFVGVIVESGRQVTALRRDESGFIAQKRGIAVVQRLLEKHPKQQIVLSTHGNLMALVLQPFDPSVDYIF